MALPLQALMLLLLAAACLVPMAEDDFSCVLSNNFRRSLDPMVRYMNGTPPFWIPICLAMSSFEKTLSDILPKSVDVESWTHFVVKQKLYPRIVWRASEAVAVALYKLCLSMYDNYYTLYIFCGETLRKLDRNWAVAYRTLINYYRCIYSEKDRCFNYMWFIIQKTKYCVDLFENMPLIC